MLSYEKDGNDKKDGKDVVVVSRNIKRQMVNKIDPVNKTVLQVFNSVSAAANSIPTGRWNFITNILDKKEHDGFLWQTIQN